MTNNQQMIAGGLNETFGATINEQTYIRERRIQLQLVKRIMDCRKYFGHLPKADIFDKLMEQPAFWLNRISDHYMALVTKAEKTKDKSIFEEWDFSPKPYKPNFT